MTLLIHRLYLREHHNLSFIKHHYRTRLSSQVLLENPGGSVCSTMKRYPSQPTSLIERSMFVSMWVGGKSAREIARETGVSPSTVCRWINRWKQEGNVYNHQPLGSVYCFLYDTSYLEEIMCPNPRNQLLPKS